MSFNKGLMGILDVPSNSNNIQLKNHANTFAAIVYLRRGIQFEHSISFTECKILYVLVLIAI